MKLEFKDEQINIIPFLSEGRIAALRTIVNGLYRGPIKWGGVDDMIFNTSDFHMKEHVQLETQKRVFQGHLRELVRLGLVIKCERATYRINRDIIKI